MKRIYDQNKNLLEVCDLNLGRLEDDVLTVHHDAVEAVQEEWHYEVVAEYPNGGKDVKKVIDVRGVVGCDEWDEDIPIYVYIPYNKEELAEIEAKKNMPTQEDRLAALEEENKSLRDKCDLLLSLMIKNGFEIGE